MTNLQLAFLLKYFAHKLENAVEECEDNLPKQAFKKRKAMFSNNTFLVAPALDPIKAFIRELNDDIEELKNEQ